MRRLLLLVLLLGGLTAQPALAQATSALDRPNIRVAGIGTVTAFPNAAELTLTVLNNRPALREAVNETQRVTQNVRKLLRQYVADTTDVKVSLISTDKVMVWNATQKKEVFAGFNASQRIIFTLTDLKRMQAFTEEVLKLRISEIERVSYFHTDGVKFMQQAQEKAVQDAVATTERLARAGNIRLGKIFYLTTDDSPSTGADESVESEQFRSYGKALQVRVSSSSAQLITYRVSVAMQTAIE